MATTVTMTLPAGAGWEGTTWTFSDGTQVIIPSNRQIAVPVYPGNADIQALQRVKATFV